MREAEEAEEVEEVEEVEVGVEMEVRQQSQPSVDDGVDTGGSAFTFLKDGVDDKGAPLLNRPFLR